MKIAGRVARGDSVSAACRAVIKSFGHSLTASGQRTGISFSSLQRIYKQWITSGRQRDALLDRSGLHRKVGAGLAGYFAHVATRPGTRNLQDAYRAVVAAWRKGTVLPGIGSSLRYPRSWAIRRQARTNPPPFPIGYDALLRYLPASELREFRRQAALAAKATEQAREVARTARRNLAALRQRVIERAAQRGGICDRD